MELIDVAQAVLEHSGALVDRKEGPALEVVAPEPLQTALGIGDLAHLHFGTEGPPETQRITLESDWLERFGSLLGASGRHARVELGADTLRKRSLDKQIAATVLLDNAVFRVLEVSEAWTRYAVMTFHYEARSDEQREGLISVGLNLHTGSLVDQMPSEATAYLTEPSGSFDPPPALPADWDPSRLETTMRAALGVRIRARVQGFLNGMQRRLERDGRRVREYHQAMIDEAWRKVERARGGAPTEGEDPVVARERLRIHTVEREHRSKMEDLKNKYALTIRATPVQSLEVVSPVERVRLCIRRRKGERIVALDYNPVLRRLDPLPDDVGDGRDTARIVCDDALHLVSRPGHAPCEGCGRPYCRACRRRCPKCDRS